MRTPQEGSLGLSAGTITHPGSWQPLGMRATHSYNTRLNEVWLQETDVLLCADPADAAAEQLINSITYSFCALIASVYLGIGQAALAAIPHSVCAEPGKQQDLVTAQQRLRQLQASVRSLGAEVYAQFATDPQNAVLAACATKIAVCDGAKELVDTAIRLTGARAYQADSELARLYRDVLAGQFHPPTAWALAQMQAG